MTAVVDGAALVVTVAGVLAGLAAALVAGLRAGLPVLLDFLLAAGLLRLTVAAGWPELATVALVVAVRHLVVLGLRAGPLPAATPCCRWWRCPPRSAAGR